MRGWYNQKWRHALAARGVRTAFASRKSLMTGEEISMLKQMNGSDLSKMSDSDIQGSLSKIRAEPRSDFSPRQQQAPQAPVQEKKKIDWMEPFKGPEEKNQVTKDMVEAEIQRKIQDADNYMTAKGIEFEDKKRIMDHYVYPLSEKFRQGGISQREYEQAVDSKVAHNTSLNSKTLGAFSWGDKKQEEGSTDMGSNQGVFNFIDKAQNSMVDKI
jgi:hypothetical protein